MRGLILPPGMTMPTPDDVDPKLGWEKVANPVMGHEAETFLHRSKGLCAIRAIEDGRWHLSVSHRSRIPTWGEMGDARDALIPPDVWMMVPHPPRRYWMNLNRYVLHLHEMRDPHLIERFKEEGDLAKRLGYGTPDDGEGR